MLHWEDDFCLAWNQVPSSKHVELLAQSIIFWMMLCKANCLIETQIESLAERLHFYHQDWCTPELQIYHRAWCTPELQFYHRAWCTPEVQAGGKSAGASGVAFASALMKPPSLSSAARIEDSFLKCKQIQLVSSMLDQNCPSLLTCNARNYRQQDTSAVSFREFALLQYRATKKTKDGVKGYLDCVDEILNQVNIWLRLHIRLNPYLVWLCLQLPDNCTSLVEAPLQMKGAEGWHNHLAQHLLAGKSLHSWVEGVGHVLFGAQEERAISHKNLMAQKLQGLKLSENQRQCVGLAVFSYKEQSGKLHMH